MPYLRLTGPPLDNDRRRDLAEILTEAIVDLFTPPRGVSRADTRSRTTVHFTDYHDDELFVGGRAATSVRPDVTIELSDWSMGIRRQRRVAHRLTPTLAAFYSTDLDSTDLDAVNLRFHSYPPTQFSVGGRLLADQIPTPARLAKRLFG